MVKKFFVALLLSSAVFPLSAQLTGDGYYRIQNTYTGRYITIIDNHGSINVATTSADFGALKTVRPFDEVVCDPGTILYIEKKGGANEYNFIGQGTNAHDIVGYYLKLKKNSNNDAYKAYQEKSLVRTYLNDVDTKNDYGVVLTNDPDLRDWNILPLSAGGSNYFGVRPDISVGALYYDSFFAGFPFKPYSEGVKVYYIHRVVKDQAVYKELTGIVPASTPVLVVCNSPAPAENRLDIVSSTLAAPTDNLLRGAYFNIANGKVHVNRVAYDPETMRVLGVCSDGTPGFVTADLDFIPANQMYLLVPKGTPAELRLVDDDHVDETPDEGGSGDDSGDDSGDSGDGGDSGDDGGDSGDNKPDDGTGEGTGGETDALHSIPTGDAAAGDVYTIDGRLVRRHAKTLEGLPRGIYIQNRQKRVVL